jgi:hypothetical protein
LGRTTVLQKIYNYGTSDLFKCPHTTKTATAAIADWTYIRRYGEQHDKATPDNKMLTDYVKSLLRQDEIFSVTPALYEAAVHPSGALGVHHNACRALCDHAEAAGVAAHEDHDIVLPVPHDQIHKHVFLKVVNLNPEMRHLQHVAGSEGWSSYIVVNKMIDCIQLHDNTLALCSIDPEPIAFKLDAAFGPDCVAAMSTLTTWKV